MAQLSATFGLTSNQELRAKWRAVNISGDAATVFLMSSPIPLFGYNAPKPIFNKALNIIQPEKQEEWNVRSDADYEHIVLSAEVPSVGLAFSAIATDQWC